MKKYLRMSSAAVVISALRVNWNLSVFKDNKKYLSKKDIVDGKIVMVLYTYKNFNCISGKNTN